MASPIAVFDLDGTLADSAPDLMAALAAVLPSHGFRYVPDPALRAGLGNGARHLIKHSLLLQHAEADEPTIDRLHEDFLAFYGAHSCVETRLYDGAAALLERLTASGWLLAICTNKHEGLARGVLEGLGVAGLFATVAGGDTFPVCKPDPGHLVATIAAAGGDGGRAIMVGDSRNDLDTARAARVPFAGVTFGYSPVPMAALGPDLLVAHYDELDAAALEQLLRRPARVTADLAARVSAP
jgi:phosphoglycolate phosphatase